MDIDPLLLCNRASNVTAAMRPVKAAPRAPATSLQIIVDDFAATEWQSLGLRPQEITKRTGRPATAVLHLHGLQVIPQRVTIDGYQAERSWPAAARLPCRHPAPAKISLVQHSRTRNYPIASACTCVE